MTVMAAEAAGSDISASDAGGYLAAAQQQRQSRQNPPPQPSGNGNNPQGQRQSASGPSFTLGGGKSYHRWVMAEFIGCVILVGATPLLNQPKDAEGNPIDTSATNVLFGADALVRLSALCLVFIILSLLANNEKSGKFAAAFGGLITAGLLVNTSPQMWAKIGSVFGGNVGSGTQATQTSSSSSGGSGGGASGVEQYIKNLPSEIQGFAKTALERLIAWG